MKWYRPRMNSEFDDYSGDYASHVEKAVAFSGLKADFFTRVKVDYLIDICRSVLGTTRLKLLDVGCGVGLAHPYMQPEFSEVHGIDPSQKSVELARERNPGVVYQTYDGHEIPYRAQEFDVAVTTCVMHHVPPSQWSDFVSQMLRVVRPGGLAVVFEHNARNPLTRRVVNNCEFDADAVLLSDREIMQLFCSQGAQGIGCRSILSVPAAGSLLRRIDRLFSPIRLGAQYVVWGHPGAEV